jgi:hypothetical protein
MRGARPFDPPRASRSSDRFRAGNGRGGEPVDSRRGATSPDPSLSRRG